MLAALLLYAHMASFNSSGIEINRMISRDTIPVSKPVDGTRHTVQKAQLVPCLTSGVQHRRARTSDALWRVISFVRPSVVVVVFASFGASMILSSAQEGVKAVGFFKTAGLLIRSLADRRPGGLTRVFCWAGGAWATIG